METVNVQAAKTHLSRLLQRVEAGETIVLARGGRPVARLEPFTPIGDRELGFLTASFPDSFLFDLLPEDELRPWES